MRDANWFADFPTSAQKVSSLYEKSGGATADGVVAVTGNFIEELLEIVGPVDMPEYGLTITPENFFNETQREVELDYDKEENRPKKFIADLFPKLVEKFSDLDEGKWPEVLELFYKGLESKDIIFYFSDPEIEKLALDFGWGGKLSETNRDYLNVVTSNIGGGKTDHVVSQDIYLDVDIKSDGSIVNTLTIVRNHRGSPNEMWVNVKNVSFIRAYVPLGSQLIEAQGFDDWFFDALLSLEEGSVPDPLIYRIEKSSEVHKNSGTRITKEDGKTVFGNWLGVEPGEEKVVKLKYKLPFKLKIDEANPLDSYSLIIQRQPGTVERHFFSKLNVPDSWEAIWEYSSDGFVSSNLEYQTDIDKDKVLGIIFAVKN
jgi:hypothetical protein